MNTKQQVDISPIGVFGRVDPAGRLYLPRQVKAGLGIKGGELFEYFTTKEKYLLLRKVE